MSMKAIRDLYTFTTSVLPLLRTATVSGTGIDLSSAIENAVLFNAGAITDGTFTPSIEESDASGSGYTAVAAADMVGTLAAMTANTNQKVSYIGKKRYLRGVYTVTGSPSTGGNVGIIVVTKPHKQPAP